MNNNKNIPLMKNNKYIAFHGVLALCAVAAVLVGLSYLWQHNDSATHTQASQKTNTEQDQSTLVDLPSPVALQDKKVADKVAKTDVADALEIASETNDSAVDEELQPGEILTNALNALREKISADDSELLHPILGGNEDYYGLRQAMLEAISEDPLLLDNLLELFEQNPNSKLGRELAAVLSETGSPKAQVLALEIATNGSEYANEDRAAALLMVADMESITSETRDGLLGNVQQETDSDLTQFSLMALKTAPSSEEDYANVHRVLQETLNRDDENVRRHASYQIGEWATSSADLAPLRTMAIEEPDNNARIRAIMSIGTSGYKDTENKNILFSVAQNDSNALARLEAWKALEAFPLSYTEKTDYTALGERIQQEVEDYIAARNEE